MKYSSKGGDRRASSQRSPHKARRSGPHTRSARSRGNGAHKRKSKSTRTFDVSQYINKQPSKEPEAPFEPNHAFTDFGLSKTLTDKVASLGLHAPTPIQDAIIPHILSEKDVVGLANTGTGKTAAFLIPLIERVLQDSTRQTLILTPTRELAIQIQEELRSLTSKEMRVFSTVCVGGMRIGPQIQHLRKAPHFIIGTPGRVLDLIGRGHITPQKINTVVLDEADRMLDMGFIHDMRRILADVPKERDTLLFSATMPASIKTLIGEFMRDPETVSVKTQDVAHSIEQDVVRYDNNEKFDTLVELLSKDHLERVLVFGERKHGVETLSKQLKSRGIQAESIHGDKSHEQRQRALKQFKENRTRVLVATDVAARGIHIPSVSHVINYDVPATYEDYVHRIGRTGRGDNDGKALTFVQ